MQSRVVLDTSSQGQNYIDTEGNETTFKQNVEEMRKQQYNGTT